MASVRFIEVQARPTEFWIWETVAALPGLVWLLKGICRRVLASTCEHGGHSHVWSGGVSTRSHRRDDHDR
jgi:hypothetical protein